MTKERFDNNFWNLNIILPKIYELDSTNRGMDASNQITIIMYHASRYNIGFIQEFFDNVELDKLSLWSLVALLRTTCMYKNKINGWKDAYLHTKNIAINENRDSERLLMGLDRNLSID